MDGNEKDAEEMTERQGIDMPFRDLPGVTLCHFEPGDHIISIGMPVDCVYYLVEGTVYRELVTEAGNESISSWEVSENITNSLIGVLALYNKNNAGIYGRDFVAKTKCICYRIPKDVCKAYLREHPELLEEVLENAMDGYEKLMHWALARGDGNMSAQLCQFLLENSVETEQGRVLPKKFTNVEIAKFLLIHKVTVARIIRRLKEEGCVERMEKGLLLKDRSLLRAYAEAQKILDYK